MVATDTGEILFCFCTGRNFEEMLIANPLLQLLTESNRLKVRTIRGSASVICCFSMAKYLICCCPSLLLCVAFLSLNEASLLITISRI